MKKISFILMTLIVSFYLTGCATTHYRLNKYRQQDKAMEKVFDYSKENVHKAAEQACKQVGLDIAKEESTDYIYARGDTGVASLQGGAQGAIAGAIPIIGLAMCIADTAPAVEEVGIYLTEIEPQKTKVEVVQDPRSVKKGKDRRMPLLNRIEANLGSR